MSLTNRFNLRQPRVKYHDYWRLVKERPEVPPEMYLCSYLVDWVNTTAREFRGTVVGADLAFEETLAVWNNSSSCTLLKSQLEKLVKERTVTKVVCFGLGDICCRPPEWWMRGSSLDKKTAEASFVHNSMMQHSMALTMAEACGHDTQLLAQDPGYTENAKDILKGKGFSIVGQFGAGGFAELDDNSVVFSVFVEAPLKQIIADIARPQMVITTGFDVFNDSE